MRFRGALLVPLFLAACAPLHHAEVAPLSTLPGAATPLPIDPTVRDVRFVPVALRPDRMIGVDPGGGSRSIEDGVRVLSLPGGAVLTSRDRLPMAMDRPLVTALPERLGGGFLFVVDATHVWRADGWLDPARPIFTSRASLLDGYGRVTGGIVAGLDRVYVHTGTGVRSWQAFDGTSGREEPLGPWPASPMVTAFAAVDGWRALAIADLRGAVATFDAGATWRPLRLSIDPRDVEVTADGFEVVGVDDSGNPAREEVHAETPSSRVLPPRGAPEADAPIRSDAPGVLGPNPLVAAVEDGWPAGDGTALVARDGALARVRLDDGSVIGLAPDAYDLVPSRCHAIALGAPGDVGFACGSPRGATVLYAFDARRGRMNEVRRFESPRVVAASGNGALVVRGACDSSATGEEHGRVRAFCVRSKQGDWREIRLVGAVGGERVVALSDGRVAIVSPPEGDLGAAHFTLLDGVRARTVPIDFTANARMSSDVQRALDVGVWLDGFEERRPGVVGGWIEAAGTLLGVEIDLEGRARFGQYVRDAGKTMISGRYGLGWTASLLGMETTDGGMTWTSIDVPAPIATGRAISSRACGPIGCSAAGWLKIGWGNPLRSSQESRAATATARRGALSLALRCDAPSEGKSGAPIDPLAGSPPPTTRDDELIATDIPGARVLAWGPKGGDWEHVGRWTVRWVWPFGGAGDARSTVPSPIPPLMASAARFGVLRSLKWSLLSGDDPSRALLVTHRRHDEITLFELEADHAPVEIERADGEPFGEIDAAIHAAGRWYLVTPPRPGDRPAAVVWQVDGPVARELARVPRSSDRAHAGLAVRADGRALGVVAAGAPASAPTRWVVPVDLESGAVGDVEPLGAFDLGDRASLPVCAGDEPGWMLDLFAPFPIRVTPGVDSPTLGDPIARVRMDAGRACLAKLAGSLDPWPAPSHPATPRHPVAPVPLLAAATPAGASLSVAVVSGAGRERRVLRCSEP